MDEKFEEMRMRVLKGEKNFEFRLHSFSNILFTFLPLSIDEMERVGFLSFVAFFK
jgi:hypothetical protein